MPHATMYIWRDRKSNGWRGGHLALALPPTGAGGILQNSFNNYISWWPADVDTPEDAERVGGNRRGALHNQLQDVRREISNRAHTGLLYHGIREHGGNVDDASVLTPRDGQIPITQSQLLIDMPESSRENALCTHANRQSVRNLMTNMSSMEDRPTWDSIYYIQDPSESLDIPLHTAVHPGLNELAMRAWFEGFLRKYNGEWVGTYRFQSKTCNCASVVLRVLLAGDASFFHEPPTAFFYRSPAGVFQYARALVQSIETKAQLNRQTYDTARAGWQGEHRRELYAAPPTADTEMPTVAQWIEMSRVGAGLLTGFARRKEQVANIDRLLGEYHNLPPWGSGDDESGNINRVLKLSKIFDECGSYMREKQNNRRFGPVLNLAQTILRVMSAKNERVLPDL